MVSCKNERSFFCILVKSCIFAFFRTLFVQVCILSCFALCFWTYRPHLLLIKKAVVREGVQLHQKFKNQREKNTKFKTSIDSRSGKSQEKLNRLVRSGSAETLCSGPRDSSALRDASSTFWSKYNGGKLRGNVGDHCVLISTEPISVQSK